MNRSGLSISLVVGVRLLTVCEDIFGQTAPLLLPLFTVMLTR